ncbi:TPA: hypothetical protein ACYLN4_000581 [Burkholderia lata]
MGLTIVIPFPHLKPAFREFCHKARRHVSKRARFHEALASAVELPRPAADRTFATIASKQQLRPFGELDRFLHFHTAALGIHSFVGHTKAVNTQYGQ